MGWPWEWEKSYNCLEHPPFPNKEVTVTNVSSGDTNTFTGYLKQKEKSTMDDYQAGDTVRLPLEGVVWLSDTGIKCITVSNGELIDFSLTDFPNVEVIKRDTQPEPEPDVGQFFTTDGELYWRSNDSDRGYIHFISAVGIAWRGWSEIKGKVELLTLTHVGEV